MTFGEPWWLWELAGIGVFVLILLLFMFGARSGGRSAVRWPRIARVVAAANGVRPVGAGRFLRRPWLLLLALTGVILTLAHPQWGTIDEPIVERSREVMIALDLSRSMLVADVPPSRLERARLLVRNLLDGLRGERVGLIVFAGTAFVQVPLSADYQILQEFLPELKPDYMPQGGTDYAGMLRAALDGYGTESQSDRFLIVLSDGESHSEAWRELLPQMRERGVRALTLGLGTPAGGFISDGEGSYLKDERGAVVLSRLEPATLQSLARETHGVYRNASEWVDLAALLEATVARGRQGRFAERRNVRHVERFQWFLAPAIALALLGLWREIAVRPRQQTVRRAHPGTPPRVSAKASATVSAALAITLAGVWPTETRAADADPKASDPDARVRETITRLVAASAPSGRDWRELADRTLVYGTGARMNQQPIAPGIVHDALAAVDLGEKADRKLTDWTKLRTELNALLDLPPEQPQPEKKPEEKPEEKPDQQEKQDQPSQDQSSDQQQQPQDQPPQSSDEKKNESSPPREPKQSPAQPQPAEGAMGEMKPGTGEEPPPPSEAADPATSPPKMRKIGTKPPGETPPPVDAQTALLLQRMREAAEKDSPARLHQLLEGDDKRPAERGRDW